MNDGASNTFRSDHRDNGDSKGILLRTGFHEKVIPNHQRALDL
ncbi:hypothetical protein [Vibrio vulnificus YJ016]|uniref:Uncharacterized protein n=1 Tax=Vibrio vulnificus (strain YJ016) TaxID=196600 RepID=Q7MME6_VIBVY|nr:hypothetical protein [Vibrio vulnificus YJ016]